MDFLGRADLDVSDNTFRQGDGVLAELVRYNLDPDGVPTTVAAAAFFTGTQAAAFFLDTDVTPTAAQVHLLKFWLNCELTHLETAPDGGRREFLQSLFRLVLDDLNKTYGSVSADTDSDGMQSAVTAATAELATVLFVKEPDAGVLWLDERLKALQTIAKNGAVLDAKQLVWLENAITRNKLASGSGNNIRLAWVKIPSFMPDYPPNPQESILAVRIAAIRRRLERLTTEFEQKRTLKSAVAVLAGLVHAALIDARETSVVHIWMDAVSREFHVSKNNPAALLFRYAGSYAGSDGFPRSLPSSLLNAEISHAERHSFWKTHILPLLAEISVQDKDDSSAVTFKDIRAQNARVYSAWQSYSGTKSLQAIDTVLAEINKLEQIIGMYQRDPKRSVKDITAVQSTADSAISTDILQSVLEQRVAAQQWSRVIARLTEAAWRKGETVQVFKVYDDHPTLPCTIFPLDVVTLQEVAPFIRFLITGPFQMTTEGFFRARRVSFALQLVSGNMLRFTDDKEGVIQRIQASIGETLEDLQTKVLQVFGAVDIDPELGRFGYMRFAATRKFGHAFDDGEKSVGHSLYGMLGAETAVESDDSEYGEYLHDVSAATVDEVFLYATSANLDAVVALDTYKPSGLFTSENCSATDYECRAIHMQVVKRNDLAIVEAFERYIVGLQLKRLPAGSERDTLLWLRKNHRSQFSAADTARAEEYVRQTVNSWHEDSDDARLAKSEAESRTLDYSDSAADRLYAETKQIEKDRQRARELSDARQRDFRELQDTKDMNPEPYEEVDLDDGSFPLLPV